MPKIDKIFKKCDLHFLYWDSEEWGSCPICRYQMGIADKLEQIKTVLQEDFGTIYENRKYLQKQRQQKEDQKNAK